MIIASQVKGFGFNHYFRDLAIRPVRVSVLLLALSSNSYADCSE